MAREHVKGSFNPSCRLSHGTTITITKVKRGGPSDRVPRSRAIAFIILLSSANETRRQAFKSMSTDFLIVRLPSQELSVLPLRTIGINPRKRWVSYSKSDSPLCLHNHRVSRHTVRKSFFITLPHTLRQFLQQSVYNLAV